MKVAGRQKKTRGAPGTETVIVVVRGHHVCLDLGENLARQVSAALQPRFGIFATPEDSPEEKRFVAFLLEDWVELACLCLEVAVLVGRDSGLQERLVESFEELLPGGDGFKEIQLGLRPGQDLEVLIEVLFSDRVLAVIEEGGCEERMCLATEEGLEKTYRLRRVWVESLKRRLAPELPEGLSRILAALLGHGEVVGGAKPLKLVYLAELCQSLEGKKGPGPWRFLRAMAEVDAASRTSQFLAFLVGEDLLRLLDGLTEGFEGWSYAGLLLAMGLRASGRMEHSVAVLQFLRRLGPQDLPTDWAQRVRRELQEMSGAYDLQEAEEMTRAIRTRRDLLGMVEELMAHLRPEVQSVVPRAREGTGLADRELVVLVPRLVEDGSIPEDIEWLEVGMEVEVGEHRKMIGHRFRSGSSWSVAVDPVRLLRKILGMGNPWCQSEFRVFFREDLTVPFEEIREIARKPEEVHGHGDLRTSVDSLNSQVRRDWRKGIQKRGLDEAAYDLSAVVRQVPGARGGKPKYYLDASRVRVSVSC